MRSLSDIFDQLALLWPEYASRRGQVELARQIATVIEQSEIGVFEAGTGTGKTLSYLAPSFLASGSVVVSTGTKNLQDQLVRNDLPIMMKLFSKKRVALLKGRANYLCPERLKHNIKRHHDNSVILHQLLEVRSWSSLSRTHDVNEILDPERNASLRKLITSNRDNCLVARCPEFNACPLYSARRKANDADIVVVNHYLLLADLEQHEEGAQTLLPKARAIIIDEAHQMPDLFRHFFGQRLSSGQFVDLLRDLKSELRVLGDDDIHTLDCVNDLEKKLVSLKELILSGTESSFERWLDVVAHDVILAADLSLMKLGKRLLEVAGRSDRMAQCSKRVLGVADDFAMITERVDPSEESVHWIERREDGYTIHLSSLEMGAEFQRLVRKSGAGWVFTSATLSVGGSLKHFKKALGISDGISGIFQSPFIYSNSVKAYVPKGLPGPGNQYHTQSLVARCTPLINNNEGGTFFLFTSHRALQIAYYELKNLERPLLVQGNKSKTELLAEFKDAQKSVLLGTQSFWEGVDVKGSGLKLLIIDKLPFPNPRDPVFSAQSKALRNKGGNPFVELALPKAVLALKQGFGRLKREEKDRGLFVLGDSRILSRSYRQYLVNNLPAMDWLEKQEEALDWVGKL